MDVREFLTTWNFQANTAPLEKVEGQLEAIKHRLEFLAAAEIVHAIVELTEKFGEMAEHIHLASEQAGISVEAFQKLAFAAGQSGVSQEAMGTALTKLSRSLYQARQGSEEAIKSFRAVGFTPDQVKGFKTSQDAMLALSDRMQNIQDPIKKNALAMALLGRGAGQMVPFLSQGSAAIGKLGDEAEGLGIILSENQIHALVEVEHAFMKVWGVIKGIAGSIAATLAPDVKYLIDTLLGWVGANNQLIKGDLQKWIGDFTYALGYVWGAIEGVVKMIINFADQHPTLFKFIVTFLAIAGAIIAVSLAASVLMGWLGSLWGLITGAATLLTSPFAAFLVAIGLCVIAVHDLWNVFHGKPTWIQAFIDWLGIGKQVESIFDAIFDIMFDILHLDFGKFITDAIGDVKQLFGFIGDTLKSFGISDLFSKAKGVVAGLSPNDGPMLNPLSAGGMSLVPQMTSGPVAAGGIGSYNVSAPISINVPDGTQPEAVGKYVQQGVQDHMDRLHRETHRSLKTEKAY